MKQYSKAVDLDNECFNHLFPQGCQRSDFLLFDETAICEFKDLCEFDVQKRAEHVAKNNYTSEGNLKRDMYKTIEKTLSKANKQIKDTKRALNKPDTIGLIIIENHISNDISVLSLLDAASRKLENGLDNTDGILCLDFVNTVASQDGAPHHLTQLVLPVAKETEETKNLYKLAGILINDFCIAKNTFTKKGYDTLEIEQQWSLDCDGHYKKYTGKVNIENSNDQK